jgi:hypothetical protein
MSVKPFQAVSLTIAIVLYHYSLLFILTPLDLSQLASLILLLFIFLFAKKQYENTVQDEIQLKKQEVELKEKSDAVLFISNFLKPKLEIILHLSDYPEVNKQVIQRQIILMEEEAEKVLEENGA